MGFFNLTQEVAIDLGTANTVIIHNGKIVLNAPSIVALEGDKMVAVGHRAQQMEGKTPANIRTVRPLRDGVIADFNAAELMIRGLVKMAFSNKHLFTPQLRIALIRCSCVELLCEFNDVDSVLSECGTYRGSGCCFAGGNL